MKMTLTQGSNTIQLNGAVGTVFGVVVGGECRVVDGFKPETPVGNEDTLTESIDFIYKGTDAQIKSLAMYINRVLTHALATANDRQEAYPIYVNFALDNDDTAWRSRVYGGKVVLHQQMSGDFKQGRWRFTLILERDPFWEGAETQAPLTNTNGTDNTAGLNVYNCNDGSGSSPNDRVNWFYCGALEGDVETPAIIKLGSWPFLRYGRGIAYLGMWNNTLNGTIVVGDTSFSHELGTDQADANSSGGSYHRESWSASQSTIASIIMTGINLNAFGGKWFRPLIRLVNQPTAGEKFWVWWATAYAAPPVVGDWEISGKVLVQNDPTVAIIELPPMRIPPTTKYGLLTAADMEIDFYVSAEAAGSHTLDVDFVLLMPMDGYRKYVQTGWMIPGSELIDDGVTGECYGVNGTTSVVAYGEPMMLKPWEPQHEFHFILAYDPDSAGAQTPITEYVTARLYYRPRRKAIG